jgi:hypothetical protein
MNVRIDWAELSEEALADRRKGKRIKLRYELDVTGEGADGEAYLMKAWTRDVSEVGCCFEIARTMIRGEIVSMRVKRKNHLGIPESTYPVAFHIMWAKQENELCIVGAEMVAPEGPWGLAFPPKVVPTKAA